MTTYSQLQCSVCRRTKDVPQDNVRAAPNQCTITKGCSGNLFLVGTTNALTNTAPVAGLTNWYPRGQVPSQAPAAPPEQTVSLSTTSTNGITLALYIDDGAAVANPAVQVRFQQQSTQDVSYQQFTYNISATTSVVSGKDGSGKNMRFDQSAIDQARVFVLVNGVARFPGTTAADIVLTPGVVGFNTPLTAGAVVSVSVFIQPTTVTQILTFLLNSSQVVSSVSGAWGNIRWVQQYDVTGQLKPKKWWLYTCGAVAQVSPSSRLLLSSITDSTGHPLPALASLDDGLFLLSSAPHDNTDRYLNFCVSAATLSQDYLVVAAPALPTELTVDSAAVIELYPPLRLTGALTPTASFISADAYSTTDAASSASQLTSSKILGPV